MTANDERNLKAVDSRRVAKDHPPKKGGKGSVRGISEILSPVTSRVTVPGTPKEGFRFPFLFWLPGACTAVLGLSLAAESRDYPPGVASVAEHGLRGFSTCGPRRSSPHPEESSQTRDGTQTPCISSGFLTTGPPRKS